VFFAGPVRARDSPEIYIVCFGFIALNLTWLLPTVLAPERWRGRFTRIGFGRLGNWAASDVSLNIGLVALEVSAIIVLFATISLQAAHDHPRGADVCFTGISPSR
jgi:hypothetical protein